MQLHAQLHSRPRAAVRLPEAHARPRAPCCAQPGHVRRTSITAPDGQLARFRVRGFYLFCNRAL
eukprot:1291945-Pleurochrysis_carterae.AAC.1